VADPNRTFETEGFDNRGDVAAEIGPVIGWVGLAAAAVTPKFNRYRMVLREFPDNLIPNAAMESGCVYEE